MQPMLTLAVALLAILGVVAALILLAVRKHQQQKLSVSRGRSCPACGQPMSPESLRGYTVTVDYLDPAEEPAPTPAWQHSCPHCGIQTYLDEEGQLVHWFQRLIDDANRLETTRRR
jgi:hypothetical protein